MIRFIALSEAGNRGQWSSAAEVYMLGASGSVVPKRGSWGVPVGFPLVPVAAGHDLAAKIPGAELDLIDGMGHDLPVALWPRFVAGIASAAGRA